MAAERVKRSQMAHFLNTKPSADGTVTAATWARIGMGHASLTTNYNPATETEQWIDQDVGTTTLNTYAPTISTSQIAFAGDPVFDFVDELAWNMATGSDSETDYLEVRIYKAEDGETTYPARIFRASIAVSSEGADSTAPLQREYTINFMGDPTFGTFDPETKAFTADDTTGG